MGEQASTPELPSLEMTDYESPVQAFNTVGGHVLTEAVRRGIVDFDVNDLQMRDAIDALNDVAQAVGEEGTDPLYEQLAFLVRAHEMPEFKRTFSFGIEAVCRDGVVGIWWPQ